MQDLLFVLLILTGFVFLGSGRMQFGIRTVALQGILLGLIPLLGNLQDLWARLTALAVLSLAIKGMVLPYFLTRAMHKSKALHEDNPFVGFTASMVVGIICLGGSFWIASRLPFIDSSQPKMAVAVSLFIVLVGFFVIISRRKALSQVLGYLVMENGVYIFGVAFAVDVPWLVELGVLLDVFVAVFVMGIVIFHISKSFDHIDTDQLSSLTG
ncbi:MAG: hydrogenase [bacterium]|nr:hydrogenase [bacterium]